MGHTQRIQMWWGRTTVHDCVGLVYTYVCMRIHITYVCTYIRMFAYISIGEWGVHMYVRTYVLYVYLIKVNVLRHLTTTGTGALPLQVWVQECALQLP